MAFGNTEWNNAAKAQLQLLYPNRTVHMIEVNALWNSGGGIHCVTNDEPLLKKNLRIQNQLQIQLIH